MVFLSLVLKPIIKKWANLVLGIAFTLIMMLVIRGGWTFYKFFGGIEIVLTLTIVWQAWSWPRTVLSRDKS